MLTHHDLYATYPDADILAILPPTETTSYEDFEREAERTGDPLFLFILR